MSCPIQHPFKNIQCDVPVDESKRHVGDHSGSYERDYEDNGKVAHVTVTEEWPNVYQKK